MTGDQRARLVAASEVLFEAGVMAPSGHGNLSLRLGTDHMLLTAVGTLRRLDPADVAEVPLDGRGDGLPPTAREITAMHADVYRGHPAVGAVVHTHSPAATAFAVAGRALPCRYEALLRFGYADDIPVVPWAPRGSAASVAGILDALRNHPGTPAVLLGNHGVLAFGPSPEAAAAVAVAVEESARVEVLAASLGGSRPFPEHALVAVRASMEAARGSPRR
jgi:L-ribulose-5-phosphate 4-epimerase